MRHVGYVTLLLCILNGFPAFGHDLEFVVGDAAAVVVSFSYPGAGDFAFESYEVYHEGEDVPFQVGRTDRQGRLVFVPDRPGKWRIKAFAEDGHGREFSIATDARGGVQQVGQPMLSRNLRIAVGVALIFGLFGLVSLFGRRRQVG